MIAKTNSRQGEDLLAAHFDSLKEEVLQAVGRKLRYSGITDFDWHSLEDAYSLAWHGLSEYAARGSEIKSVAGLLHKMTYCRAVEIARSTPRERHVELAAGQATVEPDRAEHLDDQERLRRLFARLKERLTEKERKALTLCLLRGYTRPEAAAELDMSPRQLKRTMDDASKKLATVVALLQTRGCGDEEWARVIRAYSAGTLPEDSPDYPRAEQHLDECEACQRYGRGIRGLAVILLPVMPASRLVEHGGLLAYLSKFLRVTRAPAAGATNTSAASSSSLGTVFGGAGVKTVLVLGATAAVAVGAANRGHHKPNPRHSASARTAATILVVEPTGPTSRPVTVREASTRKPRRVRKRSNAATRAAASHGRVSRPPAPTGEFEWEHHTTTPSPGTTYSPAVAATRHVEPAPHHTGDFSGEFPE